MRAAATCGVKTYRRAGLWQRAIDSVDTRHAGSTQFFLYNSCSCLSICFALFVRVRKKIQSIGSVCLHCPAGTQRSADVSAVGIQLGYIEFQRSRDMHACM